MTIVDFMATYEGFDWRNGDIVIVNQRQGSQGIYNFHISKNEKNTLIKQGLIICDTDFSHLEIYSWSQTSKTMLIVL